MFLITADCGNTRVHLAVIDLAKIPPLPADGSAWPGLDQAIVANVATARAIEPSVIHAAWDAAHVPIRLAEVKAVVVASVNPLSQQAVENWVRDQLPHTELCRLVTDRPIPIPNRTDKPWQVGQDRLLNALACRYRYPGRGAVVIDLGTAVTFDIVSPQGEYLGGVIAPGVNLALKALHSNTALLPLVKPHGKPPIIGKDTESAMLAGVYFGVPGMVRGILDAIVATYETKPLIVGTGGDAPSILAELPSGTLHAILPNLTHEGIALSWLRPPDSASASGT